MLLPTLASIITADTGIGLFMICEKDKLRILFSRTFWKSNWAFFFFFRSWHTSYNVFNVCGLTWQRGEPIGHHGDHFVFLLSWACHYVDRTPHDLTKTHSTVCLSVWPYRARQRVRFHAKCAPFSDDRHGVLLWPSTPDPCCFLHVFKPKTYPMVSHYFELILEEDGPIFETHAAPVSCAGQPFAKLH